MPSSASPMPFQGALMIAPTSGFIRATIFSPTSFGSVTPRALLVRSLVP